MFSEQKKQSAVAHHLPLLRTIRFRIAVLLGFGLYASTAMMVDMGMAVVCMVNGSHIFNNEERPVPAKCGYSSENVESYHGTLPWSDWEVSQVLTAFGYGSLTTIWWSGYVSDRLGPKKVLLAGLVVHVLVSISLPTLVNVSFYAVVVARALLGAGYGLCLPAIPCLANRWFPPKESSFFSAVYTIGIQLGAMTANYGSAFLCASDFLGGWPAIFYSCALIGVIWILLWVPYASDSPSTNTHISESERRNIVEQQRQCRSATEIPWKELVKSRPLWANVIAEISIFYTLTLLETYLPTYLKEVMFVNVKNNGFLATLPFLVNLISKLLLGYFADALRKKATFSATCSTKIFQTVANLGTISCLLVAMFLIDCTREWLAVVVFCAIGIFLSCNLFGYFYSQMLIAPNITGTLFSISLWFGCLAMAAAPLIVGIIKQYGTEEEWALVWGTAIVANLASMIAYLAWGSAETQPWANAK